MAVITENEARLLRSLQDDFEVSIPELAMLSYMMPSVVRKVLVHLTSKGIVRQTDGNHFVQLTKNGLALRKSLEENNRVLIVPDDNGLEVMG